RCPLPPPRPPQGPKLPPTPPRTATRPVLDSAGERGLATRGARMDRYPGGLPKSFLQPCLLLLLKEHPGYRYDPVTRLKALGIDDDSAAVYRSLRTLEEKGSVYSYWNTS